jgi:hypothetical protein
MLFLANVNVNGTVEPHWLDMFLDSSWFLIALILPLIAMLVIKGTFSKYNKVKTQGGRTAAQIAREMLNDNGLNHVEVIQTRGNLTDHYDPRKQIVALSESVHSNSTIGAISVAAHEVGHAIQHATGYTPIKVRHAIFPVASFGSRIWIFLFIAGGLLEISGLIWAAIGLFAFGVLFQLVTLPLEIDASRRAINTITAKGYLVGNEIAGARKTLMAAAFTYLAALLASVIQLLRFLAMARRR